MPVSKPIPSPSGDLHHDARGGASPSCDRPGCAARRLNERVTDRAGIITRMFSQSRGDRPDAGAPAPSAVDAIASALRDPAAPPPAIDPPSLIAAAREHRVVLLLGSLLRDA